MKNIVLLRIDDRLIHGQVITQWNRVCMPTEILVVDDTTYADSFMCQVLLMAVPSDYKGNVLDVESAVRYLKEPSVGERILILVKTPEVVEQLIDKGVEIKKLNVGGMGRKTGRTTLFRNISSSEEENNCMIRLTERGLIVSIQIVPEDKEVELSKLIRRGDKL